MAAIDLVAEFIEALRSPEGRAAIADAVRPLLEKHTAPPADETGDIHALQGWGGWRTLAAVKSAAARDHELAAIAFHVGRSRRWRRREVEQLLELRRNARNCSPRLRALGGGK